MRFNHIITTTGLILACGTIAVAGDAPTVTILDMDGIGIRCSADGNWLVGQNTATGEAFRWSAETGVESLGVTGVGFGVTSDGATIHVDDTTDGDGNDTAAMWYEGEELVYLGGIGESGCDATLSSAYDLSDDGTTAVGLGYDGCNFFAYKWTSKGGMTALHDIDGGGSRANATNADGSIVVGWDQAAGSGNRRGAVWYGDGTWELVGTPTNPDDASSASEVFGINSDGSLMCGWTSDGAYVLDATVEGNGFIHLGEPSWTPDPNFTTTNALDIADNGTVIGNNLAGFGPFASLDAWIAFPYAEGTPDILNLHDYLVSLGWDDSEFPEGWVLANATSISDDGLTIAGWGHRGFILDQFPFVITLPGGDVVCPTDFNGDNTTDTIDLLDLLGNWGACKGCAQDLNGDNVVDTIDLLDLLGNWGACE